MVIAEAAKTELSNDRVMRLGDERLALRAKLIQMSRAEFWKKEIAIPDGLGRKAYRYVMKVAWKSFPYWHQVVHRKAGAIVRRIKNITEARDMMSLYLSRIKGTAKRIIDFMYGTRANPTKRTIKRNRTMPVEDILDNCHLLG